MNIQYNAQPAEVDHRLHEAGVGLGDLDQRPARHHDLEAGPGRCCAPGRSQGVGDTVPPMVWSMNQEKAGSVHPLPLARSLGPV